MYKKRIANEVVHQSRSMEEEFKFQLCSPHRTEVAMACGTHGQSGHRIETEDEGPLRQMSSSSTKLPCIATPMPNETNETTPLGCFINGAEER